MGLIFNGFSSCDVLFRYFIMKSKPWKQNKELTLHSEEQLDVPLKQLFFLLLFQSGLGKIGIYNGIMSYFHLALEFVGLFNQVAEDISLFFGNQFIFSSFIVETFHESFHCVKADLISFDIPQKEKQIEDVTL